NQIPLYYNKETHRKQLFFDNATTGLCSFLMQHNPASYNGIDFHKKTISGGLPPDRYISSHFRKSTFQLFFQMSFNVQ
ncbi:hypothetical protein, partial [Bacillus tropicus]|uniref:hypothetical protein n=1 Tax=Bacillus tropicus TaxID=2026188 RepID=UPI001C992485